MTPQDKIILNQQKKIEKLESQVSVSKYNALLKKYQNLLVENKLNEQMMVDMRRSVENLLKKR